MDVKHSNRLILKLHQPQMVPIIDTIKPTKMVEINDCDLKYHRDWESLIEAVMAYRNKTGRHNRTISVVFQDLLGGGKKFGSNEILPILPFTKLNVHSRLVMAIQFNFELVGKSLVYKFSRAKRKPGPKPHNTYQYQNTGLIA